MIKCHTEVANMKNLNRNSLKSKVKNTIDTAKKYWIVPPDGNYVAYKEIGALSGAGFGAHWATLLASTIALNSSNFLVGASIGLKPVDLQLMLNLANLLGIPLGLFRSWYYDNHNLKGGKFLPFIRMTCLPIVLISLIFVWLPYEYWNYITKVVVVEVMYILLNIFLCFYNESYTYFQQIITPNSNERSKVMSISQVIYSMAPTITGFALPTLAALTWGQDNIWTYRVIYPVFCVIGLFLSSFFFKRVKERLILPKSKPEPVRIIDAIREVSKNKYFWITQAAAWVVFLESGYGYIFGWAFVYSNGGEFAIYQGTANTIISNAALWSMLLTPIAIKFMGKRNLLIACNAVNIVVLIVLYFTYQSLIWMCVIWYFNTFVNTFWNIVQHNISADMRDYHQWKTGVRVDGLFGTLGIIGTFIGFFTGMFYPTIQEKMGLQEGKYNVLLDDTIRNNLFEVLIFWSIVGAALNLIPFIFYDLTENKHESYVGVLRIRAMFENHALGLLDDDDLRITMRIIYEAKEHYGKTPLDLDKTALKTAKKMPNTTDEEKLLRLEAIKKARESLNKIKETNLAIERAPVIIEDLNKFSGEAGKKRIEQAEKDLLYGKMYFYENAKQELKKARKLPKTTKTEKEIRSDTIKNLRIKRESAALIRKYGQENIVCPDEAVKEELLNRETSTFFESMHVRKELRRYLKAVSIYTRATKPYADAELLLKQADYYADYDELEKRYLALCAENA